jgi:hypothetical protein
MRQLGRQTHQEAHEAPEGSHEYMSTLVYHGKFGRKEPHHSSSPFLYCLQTKDKNCKRKLEIEMVWGTIYSTESCYKYCTQFPGQIPVHDKAKTSFSNDGSKWQYQR